MTFLDVSFLGVLRVNQRNKETIHGKTSILNSNTDDMFIVPDSDRVFDFKEIYPNLQENK